MEQNWSELQTSKGDGQWGKTRREEFPVSFAIERFSSVFFSAPPAPLFFFSPLNWKAKEKSIILQIGSESPQDQRIVSFQPFLFIIIIIIILYVPKMNPRSLSP